MQIVRMALLVHDGLSLCGKQTGTAVII